MASRLELAHDRRFGSTAALRAAVAWLVLALLVCLPGCRGCSKSPEELEKEKQQAEEKAKKKKKEEEVKPFEAGEPRALPTSSLFTGTCKPGHWLSQFWPDLKANLGDFQGEVQTEIVDRSLGRVRLEGMSYELTDHRPAALAKKQQKSLESFAWIPPEARNVNFRLTTAGGGATAIERSMMLRLMPSYQYFFIVLAPGSRFDYLNKRLNSIRFHRLHADSDSGPKFYEVVTMSPTKRPDLPTNSLYWTSIAYLLWDEADPALWDVDQQQALIDWLHWGGQIIVSGPAALEQLQGSFLRSYLPATVGKVRTFDAKDLSEFQCWAGKYGDPPKPVRPWPGAELKKDPRADYLPYTNDAVIERRVGRGRIVATAFRMTGPEFTGWEGCDCFFNACLMRRGPREFFLDPTAVDEPVPLWTGKAYRDKSKQERTLADAKTNTSVRYFSRDGARSGTTIPPTSKPHEALSGEENPYGYNPGRTRAGADISLDDDFGPPPLDMEGSPGLGGWNDYGPVATAAREALRQASGIIVPERSFIVWVVVGYICVLVPLNWLFFRLIGRVEWAWIAAPLIAIGCTVVVVHQAQLNIGFARSRNELAVIEMQPGYSRVHTTRYTALYTSLATWYDLQLNDPGGQVLPFPQHDKGAAIQRGLGKSIGEVACRRGDDTRLTGFHVDSNEKDYIHSEEMADFGGTVALRRDTDGAMHVTNGTKHPLENCHVIRNGKSGAERATIERLDPGATVRLNFKKFDRRPEALTEFLNSKKASDPNGELSDEGVRLIALHIQEMRPDEVCLLARVADGNPGLTITPDARQSRQAALLVAHLDAGKLDDPLPDEKSKGYSPSDARPASNGPAETGEP